MTEQELTQVVTQLLNKGDKKSLGSTLLFVQQRWVEEHEEEEWVWYENFMRNGLRKVTPRKTKFISFTNGSPTNPLEITLIILLHGCTQPCKIIVNNQNLTWTTLDGV